MSLRAVHPAISVSDSGVSATHSGPATTGSGDNTTNTDTDTAGSPTPQKGPDMTLGKITPRRAHSVMLGLAALATSVLIAACGSSSNSSGSTNTTSTTPTSAQPVSGSRGFNARSGPAAGGSIGEVSSVSTSGFGLLTSAGETVAVKEASSTTYQKDTNSASASAVTKGKTALVVGTTDSTTITATQVIVQPTNSTTKTSSQVVAFKRGAPSTSKTIGQIPANYKQGSGTIVSGTTANKATKAALAAYPGGIVDRVVKLSNGEYEVHNIGVNWPHHIFVTKDFKVVGAN